MKKLFISIIILLVIVLASVFIFIPNIISFNESCIVNMNREGIARKLFTEHAWHLWLSDAVKNDSSNQSFSYHNSYYLISKNRTGLIFINNRQLSANTLLVAVSKATDTTQLFWSGLIATSYNPVKRFQIFLASQKLKADINSLLLKMQSYFSKTENVYDYTIKHALVTDSLLVSTSAISKSYPSIRSIYQLIDRLKNYIASQGAKETGAPMLNVSTNDSIYYLTRVAIPVNQQLPPANGIAFKQMLGGGNILVVEVKGGPFSIKKAFYQIQNYLIDYHETAPAIPFESLITDRRKETDTLKWVTRIYYPVM